jgi:two-component system, OmpR family, phosphate regulon sensor histidine kinase PhoR
VQTICVSASTLQQRVDELDIETVKSYLQLILTQTDRIQALVRDLLLLARVSGDIAVLSRPFHPRDLLLPMIDDLGEEAARVRTIGHTNRQMVGDAELVLQVVRPLVENALIHGPRSGLVTVSVTVMGDRSLWEVHDGGTRISPEAIDSLFRPFTCADNPVERRGPGTGLGLTLARAYAETLHGTVGARVDEAGTVFWLDVPAGASPEAR